MFCKYCGAEIAPESKFCKKCGAPQQEGPQQGDTPFGGAQYSDQSGPQYTQYAQPANIKTGLVGNIVFLALSFFMGTILSIPTGIIGVVFSALAYSAQKNGNYGEAVSKAKVGRILMWVTIALFAFNIIMAILAVVWFANTFSELIIGMPENELYNELQQILESMNR